jgi:hypothetical protein
VFHAMSSFCLVGRRILRIERKSDTLPNERTNERTKELVGPPLSGTRRPGSTGRLQVAPH